MKQNLRIKIASMITFCLFLLPGYLAAQDSLVSQSQVTTTITQEQWYLQPWVWIVGGAVLLLLLVAMFSSSKSKASSGRTDRVTVTKTVRSESDVDS